VNHKVLNVADSCRKSLNKTVPTVPTVPNRGQKREIWKGWQGESQSFETIRLHMEQKFTHGCSKSRPKEEKMEQLGGFGRVNHNVLSLAAHVERV
jgi:hypothetical protein